jgi:hypothetical protein
MRGANRCGFDDVPWPAVPVRSRVGHPAEMIHYASCTNVGCPVGPATGEA